jgi:hypothetical protein
MDLEPISRYNPPTEPEGQERRIGRPDSTVVGSALGVIPAGLQGTVNISGGAVVTLGVDDVLEAKVSATAGFTTVTVAAAAYATGADLINAVNAALLAAGLSATARLDSTGSFMVLQSNNPGVGSYVEVDIIANSTFSAVVGFNPLGDSFTVPTVAIVIVTSLPVGGPLDVSTATLVATVGAGATPAQIAALANAIAPQFIDTDVAIKSFQVGMMHGFLLPTYTPDPNRLPAMALGPAIEVVADDGVTPFVAPLTVITGAVHDVPNAGDISITGTNLAHPDPTVDYTMVRITSADGAVSRKLYQYTIRTTNTGGTQGVVTPTLIRIPASLLGGLGVAGSKARAQYTSLASNLFTVT